jgi:hypothetical protein
LGPERVAKALFRDRFRNHFLEMRAGLWARNDSENAPVAQLDRASDYESEGRTFESFRARQLTICQTSYSKLRPK